MATVGVHTYIDKEDCHNNHSWITYNDKALSRDFSVYPNTDYHNNLRKNLGQNGAVLSGIEYRKPTASLFRDINNHESKSLLSAIEKDFVFNYEKNNSSHWVCDIWKRCTGIDLANGPDVMDFDPPGFVAYLEDSIKNHKLDPKLERREINGKPDVSGPSTHADQKQSSFISETLKKLEKFKTPKLQKNVEVKSTSEDKNVSSTIRRGMW